MSQTHLPSVVCWENQQFQICPLTSGGEFCERNFLTYLILPLMYYFVSSLRKLGRNEVNISIVKSAYIVDIIQRSFTSIIIAQPHPKHSVLKMHVGLFFSGVSCIRCRFPRCTVTTVKAQLCKEVEKKISSRT